MFSRILMESGIALQKSSKEPKCWTKQQRNAQTTSGWSSFSLLRTTILFPQPCWPELLLVLWPCNKLKQVSHETVVNVEVPKWIESLGGFANTKVEANTKKFDAKMQELAATWSLHLALESWSSMSKFHFLDWTF